MTPLGWSDELFLRTVHRWADAEHSTLTWPNFEAGHRGGQTVWGTYSIPKASPDIFWGDVPGSNAELGLSALTPIADAWRAGHRYSTRFGNSTGILTFESSYNANGPVYGLIQIRPSAGLVFRDILRSELGNPSFADPGAVIQAVDRWAHRAGFLAGVPDFEQGLDAAGRVVYGALMFPSKGPLGVVHRDAYESELAQFGPNPPPHPKQYQLPLPLHRVSPDAVQFAGDISAYLPGADRPISWYSVNPPSTWNVSLLNVTHNGATVVGLPKNTMRHDFDGRSPIGSWSVTFTGNQIIDDVLPMTIGLA